MRGIIKRIPKYKHNINKIKTHLAYKEQSPNLKYYSKRKGPRCLQLFLF